MERYLTDVLKFSWQELNRLADMWVDIDGNDKRDRGSSSRKPFEKGGWVVSQY